MHRFCLLIVPGLVAAAFLTGCAGPEEHPEPPLVRRPKKSKAAVELAELDKPTDGTFKGRVVLDGPEPKIEMVKAMAEHNDSKVCLAPDASEFEKQAQQWILAPDKKGVANVVVKLVAPKGKKFKALPPKKTDVEIDQPHCAFVPHVQVLAPGQRLVVKNSAKVPHNIKMSFDPSSGNANKSIVIPPGKDLDPMEINYQKKPIDIACDFHSWMTGKVLMSDHPYIAVTDNDGKFAIPNVPTGEPLTIVGYHEGGTVEIPGPVTFKPGVNEQELKVKPR